MQDVPRIESPQSERVKATLTYFQNALQKIFASSRRSDKRRSPLVDFALYLEFILDGELLEPCPLHFAALSWSPALVNP
jgi:hypothetical protein